MVGGKIFQNLGRIAPREGDDVSRKEPHHVAPTGALRNSEEIVRSMARNNFSSSFSLTGYLPIYSSRCLPRFSMRLHKPQQLLACIAPATPINSLAT
jgi:hypothetical protein